MVKRKRTYNTNLIKKTLSYTVNEIAELFGIHKGTVLSWLKNGLKTIDKRRPYYIHGSDLVIFLKERQSRRKQKCKTDELLCMRCRSPRKSIKNEVILKILTDKTGQLIGACEACGTKIFKTVSLKKLGELHETFTILKIQDRNLIGFVNPNVNIDL